MLQERTQGENFGIEFIRSYHEWNSQAETKEVSDIDPDESYQSVQ